MGKKCRYQFSIPSKDFVDRFGPVWAAAADELRADDLRTGERDDLAYANYPSLQVLLNSPSLLSIAVKTYLAQDLFRSYIPWKKHGPACGIDTVDHVFVNEGRLVLEGDAYRFDYAAAQQGVQADVHEKP